MINLCNNGGAEVEKEALALLKEIRNDLYGFKEDANSQLKSISNK